MEKLNYENSLGSEDRRSYRSTMNRVDRSRAIPMLRGSYKIHAYIVPVAMMMLANTVPLPSKVAGFMSFPAFLFIPLLSGFVFKLLLEKLSSSYIVKNPLMSLLIS